MERRAAARPSRERPTQSSRRPASAVANPAEQDLRDLAWFRYNLRKFLHFSEKAARQSQVTPQQHQLMLGIAGYTGRGWATVSELAEFLQERHNSVVGLVERAVQRGLVRKKHDTADRRFVSVYLTRSGEAILAKLSAMHQGEVKRIRAALLKSSRTPPQSLDFKKKAPAGESIAP